MTDTIRYWRIKGSSIKWDDDVVAEGVAYTTPEYTDGYRIFHCESMTDS